MAAYGAPVEKKRATEDPRESGACAKRFASCAPKFAGPGGCGRNRLKNGAAHAVRFERV